MVCMQGGLPSSSPVCLAKPCACIMSVSHDLRKLVMCSVNDSDVQQVRVR